ncbi:hypothetical protein LHP98_12870, partial [Rhodobacter sp. Har01]|uniref:hypothetical protein n=1 Tax=Rhodobacter sp. Har01 TaxID=2883999 RepID=UPI001D089FCE
FTTCSAGAFVVTRFFLISTSMWGQDEPQTLRHAITPNCSMGADAGHAADRLSISETEAHQRAAALV